MSLNISKLFSRFLCPRCTTNRPFTRGGLARRPLGLELLEARAVPAAPLVSYVTGGNANTAIVGTVYEDLDSNGVRNNGENGVSGWAVYLDLDNSGTLNRDAAGDLEPSAVTNKDGDYSINHLMPGTYRISEVMQAGWEPTTPMSQDVTVVNNKSVRADFFNFSGGDIVGTVWNDFNADGTRQTDPVTGAFTEPGLEGWTVFLDSNNNRAPDPGEPSTLTDAAGNYAFTNLPPNDYEVTVLLPGGWDISPGFDNRQTASVVARTQVTQDFAFFSLLNGSLKGTIWNDTNIDGVRGTDPATGAFTEPGLADWNVFLDLNNNGAADAGEPSATTDANGDYSFISLPAGDYEVTEILPTGWDVSPGFDSRQTVAVFAGEQSIAGDFANFTVLNGSIRGTVWNDLNRNGARDATPAGAFTDPGLAGWAVYIDSNHNNAQDATEPVAVTDANGGYVFADLQVGDYDVREVLPSGWEPTVGFGDNATVHVYSGAESVAPDFANFNIATATAGSISGTVWNDLNANGLRDTDPGLSGWTVFADLNANGMLDATEPSAVSAVDGSYTLSGILPGTVTVLEQVKSGWRATAPTTGLHTLALRNGESATGYDFGNWARQDAAIRGTVFADLNANGVRDTGERGLDGVTVYLDLNGNGSLDAAEPTCVTSVDLFYTPATDESGSYSFTHLAAGTYSVRTLLPATLGATPQNQRVHSITLSAAEDRAGVDTAAVYRATEIHGVKFDDVNGDHRRDPDEPGVGGATVYVDLDRDNVLDAGEPTTVTAADGSYSFSGLEPGAYVVREVLKSGYEATYPGTTGGTLWPSGVSNPAVGNVSPASITLSLAAGATSRQTVSLTLPDTGALTNLVDVFLLFDDTGSFVNNSPIVRSAFPSIITQLQSALPGIDLGFGVGRFEEYGNFAAEYSTGRPFILNQPIVAASTAGYMTAIQAALNRTTPGYGGDGPETDIEALYQLVTGRGFDGNNNGTTLDSGAAGLVSTQLSPGGSGDVPSFASFQADAAGNVMAAAGSVGGGGFRSGALPIILVATDIGFAYQPHGETTVTGVGGVTVPVSSLTGTSRPTTPFNSGAGLQETVTGLNALGGLVIGLGTNTQANVDPRQGLEALSRLTGAVNRSTTTIANGTADPIAPGDPLYFQIASGFASSVSNGVVNAIQNAVTNVAVDVTVKASDPRVRIVNHTGIRNGIGSGQTATFDIGFVGEGVPRRFDLQFVRNGTDVVLGSIPVVIGTPIPGNGYEFEELEHGAISNDVDFGSHRTSSSTPSISVSGGTFSFDGATHAASATATGSDGSAVSGTFSFTYNESPALPVNAGVYKVVATFVSSDPNYSDATGTATLTITSVAPTLSVTGGTFTYDGATHAASAAATGPDGSAVSGSFSFTYTGSPALPVNAGVYNVVATFTSSDPNYSDATGTATLTITSAAPSISVSGGTFTYDGAIHAASATATGVDGSGVIGSFSYLYNGSAVVPVDAGSYAVTASFVSSDPNYANASADGTILIEKATPSFSGLNAPAIDQGTASAMISGRIAAGPVVPTGATVTAILNGITFASTVDAAGSFSLRLVTGYLLPGTFTITVSFAGTSNFNASADVTTTLQVNAVAGTIVAEGIDISGVAGAPLTRTVATFTSTVDTGSLRASIAWGDGTTTVGTIQTIGGVLSVVGTHTFASPGTSLLRVTISDTMGLGISGSTTSVATLTSLGLKAGKTKEAEFWHENAGQALLRSFNGGADRTELSAWLAGNFSNLYGVNAGHSNLTGKTNAAVAAYFQDLWKADHDGAAVQVLTTALNVYATTTSLGGVQGQAYGFAVSITGLGARTFNVGGRGTAVGVANGSKLNVFEMLCGVNAQARDGSLYNGDRRLLHAAADLFEDLNSI
jgi:hypothetical protein